MQHPDQVYGYSIVILAAAPLASQLAVTDIRWVFFFPIFALPALSLMMTVGHLSKSAAVQTFRKLAPISAGIGWALTWHVVEKLYVESLRATQTFMYILVSLRSHLSWAVSCGHTYNTEYCHDFEDPNTTVTEKKQHYPDNFWPAQEFNKYVLRRNDKLVHMPARWEANAWYLGANDDMFELTFPSIPLVAAHVVTWGTIYLILSKYYDRLGDILLRAFLLVPVILYMAVLIGMTGFGFHFTTANIQKDIETDIVIAGSAMEFWQELKGFFRSSILIFDYSTAFTGFVLLATSRLRSGVNGLTVWLLVPFMMLVPMMLSILRLGCEGHVADAQPEYNIYASLDETVTFDLLPVCFATTTFGPVWAVMFYTAHYLYSSLGPMVVFVTFIYQSFIDDFPTVQNSPPRCIGMIALAFFLPSLFLYMPLGVRIAEFFRYASQTSFVAIAMYLLIFFVYGWQKLERDVLMTTEIPSRPSLVEYFTRPTSPIFTALQFTLVPMMLMAKFIAVFDFVAKHRGVRSHIESGLQFLPFPDWLHLLVGYLIMFAPLIIMLTGAALVAYQMVVKHGLTWKDTIKPSPDWMSHSSVNPNKPRPHSLAYSVMSRLVFRRMSYKTATFSLFLFESFVGIFLIILFFLNSLPVFRDGYSSFTNQYRSGMLLAFVVGHVYAVFELRKAQQYGGQIEGERLSFYIMIASLQTAVLNGYMWMYAEQHSFGTDWPPFFIIVLNLFIRGFCILLAIAIRAHSLEHNRPSNTREASEIDIAGGQSLGDVENPRVGADEEDDDDSPVIFDLARA